MILAFVTNYYTPHQTLLSESFDRYVDEFYFIETLSHETEVPIGWRFNESLPSFVVTYDQKEKAQSLINKADVVIIGSASDNLLDYRHKHQLLNFRYSERIFKNGIKKWQLPLRYLKYYFRCNRHKNDYLLCASAYTAADFALTRSFIDKSFKWGYFPPVSAMSFDELYNKKKEKRNLLLLWAGRFIYWKHPEKAVLVAEYLAQKGYSFTLKMIGTGEMFDEIHDMISDMNLQNIIELEGAKKPHEVRDLMDASDIFVYTSDFNEGWGAVLNEAMASGCAVVSSHAIGSAPFLIENLKNGVLYKNNSLDSLCVSVEGLIKSEEIRKHIGFNAVETIHNVWNAENAAKRFVELSEALLSHNPIPRYKDGPCSGAKILKNDWF